MRNNERNNNFNNQRRKKEIRTYGKTFQDFTTGIKELSTISDVASNILQIDMEAENVPIEEASMQMFNAIADNFPSLEDRNTSFWSINMSSTRCILKTGYRVSFGWKLKYEHDRASGYNIIHDIEFFITDFSESKDISEISEQLGWALEENK